ncbi:MAG: quinone-dependent dihydroorotate dehydrogenase, partial [Bradymonadaceae bacterium]
GSMYRHLRPLLFQFDAESIHRFAMRALRIGLAPKLLRSLVRAVYFRSSATLRQTIWGLDFPNPVGLAAGFDKNAECINQLACFGFGFVEGGTITGKRQEGNPRPRMFRLSEDRALLNRMGFNNHGSEIVGERLDATDIEPLLGMNIGKSKVVPLEEAGSDYEVSFRRLFDPARYFVVNVSSPNTPGLRDLQKYEPLAELLGHLSDLNRELADERGSEPRPMLVKLSPDLSDAELDAALRVVDECDIDGVIATNTTVRRDNLQTDHQRDLGPGGISGRPLHARSLAVIRRVYRETDGDVPIIGVGGIFSAEDALAAIRAGASLVQVWTGFVYEGPSLPRRINDGLAEACEQNGWDSISEAVGLEA